jgi:Predicted metal-dependent hydrolase with the TIM-barrel fold
VAPDHPVYIRRGVGAGRSRRPFPSVANSRALARAGVTRDTRAPHNVEILTDAGGEPTGVFLERNFVPVLEYTLFRDLPRFKYCDRVESVRLGAHAYAAAGTTSLYEGHGLTPTVIRAYRENAERDALPLRMHAPVSMPSAAFDDKRLVDLFYHYAGPSRRPRPRRRHPAGGRHQSRRSCRRDGRRHHRAGYPYDQWAGHFYQAMTAERFVKLGIEAARLGLRVNCVISRDIEYGLGAYEAIDKEVSIRDRRWVMIHVNQATDAQIRRMKALGVIATVVPGSSGWPATATASTGSARRASPSGACWMGACRSRCQPTEYRIPCCGRRGSDCTLGRGRSATPRRESADARGGAARHPKRPSLDL